MELTIEKLLGFMMVLTRISAFFIVLPVFGWKSIPVRIKIAITVLVTIFFSMITPSAIEPREVSLLEAILLLANEATYGLALGLIVYLVFATVKFSGRIIERQMGLAMAQILDPLTSEQAQPLGMLLETIFILLFLSANGHHMFLLIISRSYEAFPAGNIPTMAVLASGIIKAGSTLLMAGLRLSAPILAAFLVLMVALAVLARIVPEMNILFISLPLRVGLGLLMAAIFVPFINGFVAEFADWMGKLLPL
ncbi:Flagellar biosynthetic protein FliR [subsurface metagenome]